MRQREREIVREREAKKERQLRKGDRESRKGDRESRERQRVRDIDKRERQGEGDREREVGQYTQRVCMCQYVYENNTQECVHIYINLSYTVLKAVDFG